MESRYALINNDTLKVHKFRHKDDFKVAIITIVASGCEITSFRYYKDLDKWVAYETCEEI